MAVEDSGEERKGKFRNFEPNNQSSQESSEQR